MLIQLRNPIIIYPKANISYSAENMTLVTIHVVDEKGNKATFIVHKVFICHYSPYFDAAFNGDFVEGSTQAMDLEFTSIDAFALFVNWIYHPDLSTFIKS